VIGPQPRGEGYFQRLPGGLPWTCGPAARCFLTVADREHHLLKKLSVELGEDALDLRREERQALAEDALGNRGVPPESELPLAVVRPADARAVARLLKICSENDTPVVAYGAGTGLMGGARSTRPSLVLDTSRLDSVSVQEADRLVWAGAGAVLEVVDQELRRYSLGLGHDPWTFPVASVGGAISTNGLGYKGGRYGGMGDQVLALEVALADGSLVRTRAVVRRSTGPDLARLFIAAEGTLGIITAAALRAYPLPEREAFLAFGFQTFEAGFRTVDTISALGLRPSFLDYGEEHASPWPDLRAREEEPPVLYLGFEGFREQVEASLTRARAVALENGGTALAPSEAERLWQARHVVAERFRRESRRIAGQRAPSRGVAIDYLHVTLPPSRVLEFRELCHRETQAAAVALFECGLWTGPELFSSIVGARDVDGGHALLAPVMDRLLAGAQDLGGSMEYCHGVGLRLAHLMESEHGEALDLLRRLKATLDPRGILNPGKVGL
jgi:alkyldihydroxyacetonephosphate synthase